MNVTRLVQSLAVFAGILSLFSIVVLFAIFMDNTSVHIFGSIAFIAVVICLWLLTLGLLIVTKKLKSVNTQGETDNSTTINEMANDLAEKTVNAVLLESASDQAFLLDTLISISEGNLDITIPDLPAKKAVLSETVKLAINNLQQFQNALKIFATNVACGKLDEQIDLSSLKLSGNWINVTQDLNQALKSVHEPFDVILKAMNAMSEGDFRYRAEGNYEGVLQHIINTVNTAMEVVSGYVEEIDRMLDDISEGNLKGRIEKQYVGTFDLIKRSVNSILGRLNETMSDIELVAEGVSAGALQLSQSSIALSVGVTQQTASVQELSTGISEIDGQARDNAASAKKASDLASMSKKSAEIGNKDMQSLLEAMDEIANSTSQISNIIKTIEDIAFQTNLLALNAAVEASRAGVHGSGFAVVAEAVRSLANESAEAAKETSILIKSSIASVNDGMKRATSTASSLGKIVTTASNVAEVVNDIHKSSLRQSETMGFLSEGLSSVAQMIQDEAATSQQTASAAEELDAQVITLQQKLSYFQTRKSSTSMIRAAWVVATLPVSGFEKVRSLNGASKVFNSGDIIITEGDENADSMYFVLDGNVEVFKSYASASEHQLATLRPGDIFGEMSLFLGEPRSATVVAREKVELMQVKENDMYEFMLKYPDVAYDITKSVCVRLRILLDALDAE